MNGQAVGLREIDGNELDASFHQIRDKGDVAGQAVEFGDGNCARRSPR
jgi:hypothetical protein